MEKETGKRTRRSRTVAKTARPKTKPFSFQFSAPEAERVTIAGDFNNWDTRTNPLKRGEEGVWKVTLRLKPGTYQYKFVVNDQEWREDPVNPDKTLSSFGTVNSVCEVI